MRPKLLERAKTKIRPKLWKSAKYMKRAKNMKRAKHMKSQNEAENHEKEPRSIETENQFFPIPTQTNLATPLVGGRARPLVTAAPVCFHHTLLRF